MTTVKEMNKAVEPFGLTMKRFKWGFTFATIDPAKQERCDIAKWGRMVNFLDLKTVKIEDVVASAEGLAKRMDGIYLPPPPIKVAKVFKGVAFDDITVDEYGEWSQICQECLDNHNLHAREDYPGEECTCGVVGCQNQADYYIDFVKNAEEEE